MNASLLARIQELRDLQGLLGLASWDQETYLPKKGEGGRASQLSTLMGLYHERLTDPRVGDWLTAAAPQGADELRMVQLFTRERDRAVRVPSDLVKAITEAQSHALSGWKEARTEGSYAGFMPHVRKLLALKREQADALGHQGERYDALLEAYEPGMRVARLTPVLQGLRKALVPMVDRIAARPSPARVLNGKRFDVSLQTDFAVKVLETMGFDFEAGRQDRSSHPFTGGTGLNDVRLTNRYNPTAPLSSIFSAIHEGGHGLYEQGFNPEHERTPLAQAASHGLHESQSRLWENIVGRSRSFWTYLFPRFRGQFAEVLGDVTFEALLAEINRVERSLIRVEADEVTYNLHIVLRYELELDLLNGRLEAADLEQAWNTKTRELLGLEVKNPNEGVLQDIHWAFGDFGYFPTYALGNLYAASLWKTIQREVPQVEVSLAKGDLSSIRRWLREKIHAPGSRFDAEALVTQVTGRGLTDADFLDHLRSKYQL